MNTYLIHESNLERLEKKINSIKKKCIKNNLEFYYEKLGEQFKTWEDEDGYVRTGRFIEVAVHGEMKYNGWRFAATVEHKEAGNIIRSYDEQLVVPERYRTCGPTCEHCNKIRSRKDTYIVYNEETQEFKQVGRSCMQEYTNGLDAEDVARYISLFDTVIEGHAPYGSSYRTYINVEDVVRFATECVKHFGYEKAYYDEEAESRLNKKTTRGRVSEYMGARNGRYREGKELERIRKEMDEVGFDENSEYAINTAKAALEWIKCEPDDNGYISNLKAAVSEEYAETRDFGLIVSLPQAYNRHLGYVKEKSEKAEAFKAQLAIEAASEYVGEIKEKLTVKAHDFKCVTTLYSQFGATFLYKWLDENNNIFVWYASNPVDDEELVIEVSGTVKEHFEYRGAKQTIMTRCKVVRAEKPEEPQAEGFNFDDITFPWEQEA